MTRPDSGNIKRLFFGFEVAAPWPSKLPHGRILSEKARHMTVAFLGEVDYARLEPVLHSFPELPFDCGLVGVLDHLLFLPKRRSNVVAGHLEWLEDARPLLDFHEGVMNWLNLHGFSKKGRGIASSHQEMSKPLHLLESLETYEPETQRESEQVTSAFQDFLPHVTLCRKPFDPKEWQKAFLPIPVALGNFHLYESLGGLRYQPIWTRTLCPPFEEVEHTADVAFRIYGRTYSQLLEHARVALAFKAPEIMNYFFPFETPASIDEIVLSLNKLVTLADSDKGISMKAISYHGNLERIENGLLSWEMIIDV